MIESYIDIIEIKAFTRDFNKLVGSKERDELHQHLADSPESGDLIPGSGGLRKLRWSRSGMGKRGGVRIIYYFYREEVPLYLFSVFAKNEKADLDKHDLKILRKTAEAIKAEYQGGKNG